MAKLLSSLNVGESVKFGKHQVDAETPWDISWRVAHKSNEGIVLISKYIIDYRCFDAAELNNSNSGISSSGSSQYNGSNIDQWLNSRANSWYTAAYTNDHAPDSSMVVTNGTQYANRPGFLYNFSDREYALLLESSIKSRRYVGYTDTMSRRVFLPSLAELGEEHATSFDDFTEGSAFDLFDDEYIDDDWGDNDWTSSDFLDYRKCTSTTTVDNNTKNTGTKNSYLTRSYYNAYSVCIIKPDGSSGYATAHNGSMGIRPAIMLSSNTQISETVDNAGYYSVITNNAPTAPSSLSVPSSIKGGSSVTISWGKSTDPDGDSLTYYLERAVNGGSYSVVYSGTAFSYLDSITSGWTKVQYRVRAYDGTDYGEYKTGTAVTVSNNTAPVISGSNGNLGTKTDGFTTTYSVTDADKNSVTVVEAIDGKTLRSYIVTLGATNTFDVTGETWLTLTNGTHSLTISADDGKGGTAVRTYQFVKSVYTLSVECDPMSADTMPTRIKLGITRRVPTGATLTVMVCNNAYDTSPTWEDATETVENDTVYVFTNTSKTATSWGVAIKVTLARGDAEGSCYIKEIGGNFE